MGQEILFSDSTFIEIGRRWENSSYLFVEVYAIAGSNPLHGDNPTFPELNHYVFSSRRCINPHLISMKNHSTLKIPANLKDKQDNLDKLLRTF